MADAMSPASKKRQQTKDAKAADRLRDETAFKQKRAAQERQRLANKKAREAAEAAEKAAAAERAAATAGSAAAAAGVVSPRRHSRAVPLPAGTQPAAQAVPAVPVGGSAAWYNPATWFAQQHPAPDQQAAATMAGMAAGSAAATAGAAATDESDSESNLSDSDFNMDGATLVSIVEIVGQFLADDADADECPITDQVNVRAIEPIRTRDATPSSLLLISSVTV